MPEVEEIGGRITEIRRRQTLENRLPCGWPIRSRVLRHGSSHGDHHRMG
jgi:hypothetical protein